MNHTPFIIASYAVFAAFLVWDFLSPRLALRRLKHELGARVARELNRGTLDQVLVKGDNGYVLMLQAGNDAVLTVLASTQAKLGLIFLDAKRAATSMAQVL